MATLKMAGFFPVRIVIADEDVAFRESLRNLLTSRHGIEVVGEGNDAERIVALLEQFAPHVVLIDYALCRKLPVSGAATIRKVVMLTTAEKVKVTEAFRLGAHGIVLKGSARRTWWRCIATVVAGEYWLGNESLAVLIQAIRESPASGNEGAPGTYFGLTPREIEIVQKIADGRSNKQVGEEFSIQERTVKHHLTNIFGKIGVSSRLELALFARDNQIAIRAASGSASAPEPEDADSREEERVAAADPSRVSIRSSLEIKRRAKNA